MNVDLQTFPIYAFMVAYWIYYPYVTDAFAH